MTKLGRAATARRLYHHLLHGGQITPGDMSGTVQTIETLEADVARLTSLLQATLTDYALATIRAEDAEAERDALRAAIRALPAHIIQTDEGGLLDLYSLFADTNNSTPRDETAV